MNDSTATVTTVIDHGDHRKPETELLNDALICAASTLDPGTTSLINADQITYAFMRRRSYQQDRVVREDEVHDYVRHMLREAIYVCRHAIDRSSLYRIHPSPTCSDSCAKSNGRAEAKKRRDVCPDCFLELPMTGICDDCH
jgi:hypothetical protein